MERELPPQAPGFMPRRIGLSNIPTSYAFRALKKESEKLALEEIWADSERKAQALKRTKSSSTQVQIGSVPTYLE